jgi:hypothetical protein
MTNIDDILAERAKTHGDYTEHADCTQEIMAVLAKHRRYSGLAPDQKETLHMIAHKMGRVVTGNPDIADHWDDIAGYAKLSGDRVRQRLEATAAEPTASYVAQDTETKAMNQYTRGRRLAQAYIPEV